MRYAMPSAMNRTDSFLHSTQTSIIMKTNEIISSAIQMAESIKSAELVSALKKVAEEISGDTLKVVVLGDFKAGKSTLINTLFLKDNLLPVDYLEATAVPTHLSSGETRLQTWLRGEDSKSTLQNEWTDFDQEQVKSIVTAGTEEARAAIAEKYSRVCISKPGILPSGITLVDTLGLNTTNQRIYVGTMEEARTAHAILYVVRGRQLSERELSLLADMAGMQQPSLPIHVVVSVPEGDEPGAYRDLQNTIRAQLEGVGISQCGVSVFAMGSKGNVNVNVDDEWDPFETSTESPASAVASTDVITKDLEAFFNGPVRQGRAVRQARDLRPLLGRLLIALESCENFAGQNEEKIQALDEKLSKKRREYAEIVRKMLRELREVQNKMEETIFEKVDELHSSYAEKLEKCETLQNVHDLLGDISRNINKQVVNIVKSVANDSKVDIMKINDTYKNTLELNMALGDSVSFELQSPFLKLVSLTPNMLTTILDFVLVAPIIPGVPGLGWLIPFAGTITDVIFRHLGGQIPGIRNIMPTALGARCAKPVVKEELEKYFTKFKQEMSEKMQDNFEKASARLSEQAEQSSGFSEMEHAVQMARSGAVTEAEKAQLQEKIALCKQWMAAL